MKEKDFSITLNSENQLPANESKMKSNESHRFISNLLHLHLLQIYQ